MPDARRFLGIRLTSSLESANRGEPSWLAMLELVAAAAVAVLIIVDGRYVNWLLYGSLLAPLFLLRTEQSVRWGLMLFEPLGRVVE